MTLNITPKLLNRFEHHLSAIAKHCQALAAIVRALSQELVIESLEQQQAQQEEIESLAES